MMRNSGAGGNWGAAAPGQADACPVHRASRMRWCRSDGPLALVPFDKPPGSPAYLFGSMELATKTPGAGMLMQGSWLKLMSCAPGPNYRLLLVGRHLIDNIELHSSCFVRYGFC